MRPLPSTIRLVALDLDGTVVGRDLSVSQRVISAIAQARDLGIRTTAVTGRMYSATVPFAKKLGITDPVVCFQGAGVYDPITGEVLRHQPVSHKLVERLITFARERDTHLQLYAAGTYFVEKKTSYGAVYAYVCGVEPTVVASLSDRFQSEDSTKVVFVTDPDKAEVLAAEVRALCGSEAYVTRSNAEFVEVMAPGVDKGNSLHFVAEKLGIAPHEILAVGDAWNDIPMLKAAAFGVAMGSAPEELKAIADATVADVANDGVAEAYERFVLRSSVAAPLS
jgi:Cof subfamily protein (haloacid dehalogenase superfamily)